MSGTRWESEGYYNYCPRDIMLAGEQEPSSDTSIRQAAV